MKIALFICVNLFLAGALSAQKTTFEKGDKVLNLGIGLGSTSYGSGYSMGMPPVSASLEFAVKDKLFNDHKGAIGVAPYIGYGSYKYKMYDGYSAKFSDLLIGVRGNLHYQFVDKLDTYAGLFLGYENVSWKDNHGFTNGVGSGLGWALLIGGRYYFSDNIGAMAELGYGITYLNLGVSLKL